MRDASDTRKRESGIEFPDSSFIIHPSSFLPERGEGFDFMAGKYNMTEC
jgi:hypothetical protein